MELLGPFGVAAYIDGVLAISGHQFWTAGIGAPVNTSEFFMHLNGESGYSNQVAIDNIQAYSTVVPEPATICLLVFGSMIFMRRKN